MSSPHETGRLDECGCAVWGRLGTGCLAETPRRRPQRYFLGVHDDNGNDSAFIFSFREFFDVPRVPASVYEEEASKFGPSRTTVYIFTPSTPQTKQPPIHPTTSHTRAMDTLYTPLQNSDIRLITVLPAQADQPSTPLRLTMQQVPLTPETKYFALSYVWGDPKDSRTLLVNDVPFSVTKNLHDFLSMARDNPGLFGRRYPTTHGRDEEDETTTGTTTDISPSSASPSPPTFQWWTDAICINQTDIDEKNAQVPRMGAIYTSALRVWIWLGYPEDVFPQDHGFEELKSALGIVVRDLTVRETAPIKERLGEREREKAVERFVRGIVGRMERETEKEGVIGIVEGGEETDADTEVPDLDVVREAVQAGICEDDIREAAGFPPSSTNTSSQPFTGELSSPIFHRFLRQMSALMAHAWFERTWTIQEFVLSQNPPVAVIGNTTFFVTILHKLVQDVVNSRATMDEKSHAYTLSVMPNMVKLFNIVSAYGWRSDVSIDIKSFSRLAPERKLVHLLRNFTKRKSTVPHDYFYGLLGMLDLPELPAPLVPDYRLPFEKVCESYGRYILETTQDLKIIETFRTELKGTPSWVPDIRYLEHIRQLNTISSTGEVSFSDDGKRLTVEGVPLGKVLLCSCTSCPNDYSPMNLAFIGDLIMPGVHEITGRTMPKIFLDWLHVHLEKEFLVPKSVVAGITHMNDLLRSYVEICRHIPRDVIPHLPNLVGASYASLYETDCINPQLLHTILQLSRMRFCLLETGDIAICALIDTGGGARHGPEDCIWALKGCQNLSILRPTEGGYQYVGFCRIHRAGEEYRMGVTSAICLDDEYFASREVEKVTLV